MAIMLFLLGLGVFGLMALAPGDIVDEYVKSQMFSVEGEGGTGGGGADNKGATHYWTPEQIAAAKHELGLDQPFWEQYGHWLYRVVVEHDLGRSLISHAPVLFLVSTRMANSVVLALISLVVGTFASFSLGIWLSSKAGTKLDVGAALLALALNAFPAILLFLLLQVFAAATGWFPVTAYPTNAYDSPIAFGFSFLYHIFLPLVGGLLGSVGGSLRMIRATMLDQFGQPYVTALRARGIDEGRIRFAHAFRNAVNPFITGSSTLLAELFSGSLLLEIIFSYPGIGRLMYDAVVHKDINLVMTNVMFISALLLVGMLLSDLALALVDPRVRYNKS